MFVLCLDLLLSFSPGLLYSISLYPVHFMPDFAFCYFSIIFDMLEPTVAITRFPQLYLGCNRRHNEVGINQNSFY